MNLFAWSWPISFEHASALWLFPPLVVAIWLMSQFYGDAARTPVAHKVT